MLDPMLLVWTSPLAAGLILAAPLSVWTSQNQLAGLGLFRTPEDVRPPWVIQRAAELRRARQGLGQTRQLIEKLMAGPVAAHQPGPEAHKTS
ncbi:MAG TPA: hypothetical protein PKB04_10115, partial [Phenylobacterium sp.]|nr:hypothetical protein [Phenylobacterium sp.]